MGREGAFRLGFDCAQPSAQQMGGMVSERVTLSAMSST